jgi:hypothetical protein
VYGTVVSSLCQGDGGITSDSIVESLVKNTRKKKSNVPAEDRPTMATRGKMKRR